MIPESDMPLEEMQKVVRDGYVCGVCGGRLNIAWGGKEHVLRCGKDITHSTITRHDKAEEKIISQIKEARGMDSTSLQAMPESKMMERIGMARFPQELTVVDKKLLAQVAITYGFDPLMGEVSIYQGRPYVSIDGRYRKAQETGRLDGVETRPANKQERADWGIPEGDYFYRSEVYVKGASRPFVGWGRVYGAETLGGKGFKPVEKNPQRMAEKRAEGQALRKAFHIPLPSAEDIGSPEDIPSTKVNTITGEVIEGTCSELHTDAPQSHKTGVEVPPPTQDIGKGEKEPEKKKRDPATIKNFGDLYTACKEDFGIKDRKGVWAELNVNDQSLITETPTACYIRIAAARQ